MCQEQRLLAPAFQRFVEVLRQAPAFDVRVAVTTTTVCEKPKPNPGRGKFVYNPANAITISPECVERRPRACLADADCRADASLPDAEAWVCEKPAMAAYLHFCDKPASEGGDAVDGHPGDVLFVSPSRCRRTCDRDMDPAGCGRVFGGLGVPCDAACAGGQCSAAACESTPGLPGTPAEKAAGCAGACASDWDCAKECEAYLHDAGRCQTVCQAAPADCYATCVFAGTAAASYADKVFPREDFLCALACDATYSCRDRCIAEFGDPTYRCLYPGGDKTNAGCLRRPMTDRCPADGPLVLDRGDFACCSDAQGAACPGHAEDSSATCAFFRKWKAGEWTGDPEWTTKDDGVVYDLVFDKLFACMVNVGTGQQPCGNQSQGLLAAWLALDAAGENAAQAKGFLRPDAGLLIIVESDEDDCSTPKPISAEKYAFCGCLADTNGCRSDGTCGATKDKVMYPVGGFVDQFKSLKADPSLVRFVAIAGDVVPGSETSPGADADAARKRYFECKCMDPATPYSPATYACQSDLGRAEAGTRYIQVARALGPANGFAPNICLPEALPAALEAVVQSIRAGGSTGR
jgi:hypothetical protein